MPTITPALIPTKTPGTLFSSLTGGDDTLNIRWLTPTDPCFYEVLNRPIADMAVRQLVIAKTVDTLNIRLGHQALYPFIVQPTVDIDTTTIIDFPIGLIWDMSISLPEKWEHVRLSKLIRVSGSDSSTSDTYAGVIRLVFSGNIRNQNINTGEQILFYADYQIDSPLTFQMMRITPATNAAAVFPSTALGEEVVGQTESTSFAGFIVFKTLDLTLQQATDFITAIAPPALENTSGEYLNPTQYQISNFEGGGTNITDDYSISSVVHGTGILTDGTLNPIPPLSSDIASWLQAFNYPFDSNATLAGDTRDINGTYYNIPKGLFREFNITAPANDGGTTTAAFPVFVSRIVMSDSGTRPITMYFSTRFIGNSSVYTEFATLTLDSGAQPNDLVTMNPVGTSAGDDRQMGLGYAILSDLWDGTTAVISDWFAAIGANTSTDHQVNYGLARARLSSFGVSRISQYSPTLNQSLALTGTASNLSSPQVPSNSNKYVTELDAGLGNRIDLEAISTNTIEAAIDRFGFTGGLANRIVKLVVDSTKVPNDPTFYDNKIYPRLQTLFGRDPVFGDGWFNGTRFLWFNGDTWQG